MKTKILDFMQEAQASFRKTFRGHRIKAFNSSSRSQRPHAVLGCCFSVFPLILYSFNPISQNYGLEKNTRNSYISNSES